ncbi:hypothetical protein T11_839 [Trichinella zimbabwensis]|uniref:MULE transposase domain-containing protein n=1 Tax=Trichinella zimbabwensis TaxID=268475 RepID=A0A0V1GY82_9BILA|nr:hypothetical protein T11_13799 [Trichinella zimbabwensis]KRZ01010.1 hypothetical protein T11_4403 [Trichinella zimbabwensis]KRZ02995.1 hypothetical protein T11_15609 [Trichinella zimbabwensis]KRZ04060.1 hypothetical protein T11_839 [Trichinella zimbabwensis]
MADVCALRLVSNHSGCMSLVYEGRGVIWTNLDGTSVIKQNNHIANCPVDEHLAYKMENKAILKKRSAEETKPIPDINDEQASAAYPMTSTYGHFPLFKWVKFTKYSHQSKRYPNLPKHRRELICGKFLLWQNASRHILVFATGSEIRLQAARPTWGMDGTFKVVPQWYQQLYVSQALLNKAAVLRLNLNPETIICDFETALIPAILDYFPNTRVQGCYFYFCQAVHMKLSDLGLKTRYRTQEETKRRIRMVLTTQAL